MNSNSTSDSNTPSGSKLNVINCYFCNELLDQKYWHSHVQMCSEILEQCTGCGNCVLRRNKIIHQEQCPGCHKCQDKLNNSKSMSYKPVDKVNESGEIYHAINAMNAAIKDEEDERKESVDHLILMIKQLENNVEYITKLMNGLWKNMMEESRKETARHQQQQFYLLNVDKKLNNLEEILNAVKEKTSASFQALGYRLDIIKNALDDNQHQQLDNFDSVMRMEKLENELKDLKTFVAKESILISDIWDDHKQEIKNIKYQLGLRFNEDKNIECKFKSLNDKIDLLIDELKCHNECIDKQEIITKSLKLRLNKTIKCLEELMVSNVVNNNLLLSYNAVGNLNYFRNSKEEMVTAIPITHGRLLWRIDNYCEKMTAAKEYEAVVNSPTFFSREYGYLLKMELYLNGRDRWKDRNIIGCLKVVEGPWDPLLEWPCTLRARVTLCDQDNSNNNIKKIVKTTATRLKNNDSKNSSINFEKDSTIDMFIPHTVLNRHDGFTKNNLLFFDIQITELQSNLSASTSALDK
ncbi:TNF receptor-associated factor 3 [Microplitis mediator]|uniref:TNF receptor-associated factor 3 n=1 Tax=Microplitis mediator TaxID=375433 RepID=UPI002554E4AE|nr:TNF receptor-associated factor 3 [Microplitis mediator]